jgi:hypothetical protein
MTETSDILASLDRALAAVGVCKIATDTEAAPTAETIVRPVMAGHSATPSLVGIEHASPSNASPSAPHSHAIPSPPLSRHLQEAKAKAEPLLTRPWRKLWLHQKLARAFVAADEAGGISFTLNLSEELQDTLAGVLDPCRLMSHYINRELKKVAGAPVPYAFRFEVSPSSRLHLHGVLVPASFDKDHVSAIDSALGRAGGKLKADSLRINTQSYLGTLYDGLGWFAYCQKSGDDAARFLGTGKVAFISTPLRKLCAA